MDYYLTNVSSTTAILVVEFDKHFIVNFPVSYHSGWDESNPEDRELSISFDECSSDNSSFINVDAIVQVTEILEMLNATFSRYYNLLDAIRENPELCNS